MGGVSDGDDPDVAFVNRAPLAKRALRFGQSLGQEFSTSQPAASQITVTRSFGGVERCAAGTSAWVSGVPSGAWNPWKSKICASVGATSASVTACGYTPGLT